MRVDRQGMSEIVSSGRRRILVAVDLGPASRMASDAAILRAAEIGADLIVLTVIERTSLRSPGGIVRRVDQERRRRERVITGIVGEAAARGVSTTFLIWEGDPAESILEASMAEGVDMIMVGSRGRGAVTRRLLGSVSARVAREATCEVAIVTGPARAGA